MCFVEEVKISKTRKQYRCNWCWQLIEKGSACLRHRGIAEGSWFVARVHPECGDVMSETLDYCETYVPGEGERPTVEEA